MGSRSGGVVLGCAVALCLAGDAGAQARTYPGGVGSMSLGGQRISNTGHRLSDGVFIPGGQSLDQALVGEIAYGLSDRVTIAAALPLVAAKYTGTGPTPFPLQPVDLDRRWHSGFQDFGLAMRYNLVTRGPFALTPALAVLLPTHDYVYRGEAVIGRHLRELQSGLAASLTLAEISPRLEVAASYAYAVVETAAVAVPNDRSNAAIGVSYVATSRLALTSGVRWQWTHGGLRVGGPTGTVPGEVDTAERIAEHDRLLRDNYVHLEGGLSYSIGRVDLSASYLHYLSGTDTHGGHAITLGATRYFGALRANGSGQ